MGSVGRRAWTRFVTLARPFFQSELRWRALGMLALIVGLLLSVKGLDVFNSLIGCDFFNALANKHTNLFIRLAVLYAALFLVITVVATLARFVEERLAVLWREWLTKQLVERYLTNRAYYRMQALGDIDNPDQRITEDVKAFTSQSLSFFVLFLNSVFTLFAFSGVLWSITPWLVLAALVYAVLGTLVAILLGRNLVGLHILEQKKEANLRYEFIRVREHAESVALLGGEAKEGTRLRGRLMTALANMKQIIATSRNLKFFIDGFDYMKQIIPVLIAAPFVLNGDVEIGTVILAQIAFGHILGAFSVAVSQFGPLSTYAAVVVRLSAFCEAMVDEPQQPGFGPNRPGPDHGPGLHRPGPAITTVQDRDRIAYERVTLMTPRDGRTLIKELSLEVPEGRRLLVVGPNGVGRSSLIRATAGLWDRGEGTICRPALDEVMFLPQRPYLVPGSLRDQLIYTAREARITDDEILHVLRQVKFEPVLDRVGGLDIERDWGKDLSLSEQQQLALAGLLLAEPRFAFLDEAASALDPSRAQAIYRALARTPITYVSVANDLNLLEYHDELLELALGGAWRLAPRRHLGSVSA
jgi:putative ATP-binding cassette transporter